MRQLMLLAAFFVVCSGDVMAAEDASPPAPDLSAYRTVDTAHKAKVEAATAPGMPTRTGYLGIHWQPDVADKLVVGEVAPASPAEKAGVLAGDIVQQLDDQAIAGATDFRQRLQALSPGRIVKLKVQRGEETKELSAQLGATSSPLSLTTQRAIMGVQLGDDEDTSGALVRQITADLPAAKAGIKTGDVIRKADGAALASSESFKEILSAKSPGDVVKLVVQRDEEELEVDVQLTGEPVRSGFGRRNRLASEPNRGSFYWRRDVYRLAVVAIEFPDSKHNDKIGIDDWERSFYSEGRYLGTSATGQETFGSVNDYYREQSTGKLRVEGRFFDWVEVANKREDYLKVDKSKLLTEALDKLYEREGKDALDDYDGLCFLYAGGRVATNRGGLYWPHRATLTHRNKRWGYFIVPEGGQRMSNISVICHEFGHMLGLPDLYARPENPGSEGVSVWCAMSQQSSGGRPQHFSEWCKEKLGWLEPAIIDPTTPQKLILAPVEGTKTECYKVLVRRDGSEYLLLENRRKKGFDSSLPGEGLLIWRVVNDRPFLEESHGIEGPAGPGAFRDVVPFPSKSNTAFTPYTTPSSRSQLGGGLPVHITNICELDDGRITFWIGYEFQ